MVKHSERLKSKPFYLCRKHIYMPAYLWMLMKSLTPAGIMRTAKLFPSTIKRMKICRSAQHVNKPPTLCLTFPQLSHKCHFISVVFPRALSQAVRFAVFSAAHYSQAIVSLISAGISLSDWVQRVCLLATDTVMTTATRRSEFPASDIYRCLKRCSILQTEKKRNALCSYKTIICNELDPLLKVICQGMLQHCTTLK